MPPPNVQQRQLSRRHAFDSHNRARSPCTRRRLCGPSVATNVEAGTFKSTSHVGRELKGRVSSSSCIVSSYGGAGQEELAAACVAAGVMCKCKRRPRSHGPPARAGTVEKPIPALDNLPWRFTRETPTHLAFPDIEQHNDAAARPRPDPSARPPAASSSASTRAVGASPVRGATGCRFRSDNRGVVLPAERRIQGRHLSSVDVTATLHAAPRRRCFRGGLSRGTAAASRSTMLIRCHSSFSHHGGVRVVDAEAS